MRIIVLIIFFLPIVFGSCSLKTVPLKGSYPDKPFEVVTTSDFETVWGKTIDLFAQKGIGIKLIDKSSGLLIAHNALLPVTIEDDKGKLKDPSAWLVSTQVYEPGARKYYYPSSASVEWNIRIKDLKNGTTGININLTNIVSTTAVLQVNPVFTVSNTEVVNTKCVSTGVFEKLIADYIK